MGGFLSIIFSAALWVPRLLTHASRPTEPRHPTPTHHLPQNPPHPAQVPVDGYDVTFLLTSAHLERYQRDKLVSFICQVGPPFSVHPAILT